MKSPERNFEQELYPFLHDTPHGDRKLNGVLAEVRGSTLQKCRDTVELRGRLIAEYAETLVEAAEAMAEAFANGGKLLAFGNGGSATDAQDAAADCLVPPNARWRALPALSLVNDTAVLTALANDVGVENMFSRQVIAYGEQGDIALGISTSGNSADVVVALAEARRRGLLTIGLAGYDGGAMARGATLDFCFVARLEYVPRIQEGHATLWHTLLELTQERLAELAGELA
ncbi:MAG: SIS domain-containing protein [Gemmatimonadaceae bacterium]